MRRGLLKIIVSATIVFGGALVLGGATAATAVSTASPASHRVAAPPTRAFPTETPNPNDFTFESFDAQYVLGRDDEGRSTLHTTETLVAIFPEFDQNRGFIRDIPRELDGKPTDVQVLSVTDGAGNDRAFTTEAGDEFLSVTIAVPEGQFVRGTQQYVIEYSQRDVTRLFSDTAADEFYWDVNGTGWAQPFDHVSATLTIEGDLAAALTGEASCYRGAYGSSQSCVLSTVGNTLQIDEYGFAPGENVTIAAGFVPGTFAAPPTPFLERVPLLNYAGLASGLAGVALTVFLAIRSRINAKTGRAIIAQYEPPEGLSVAAAAILLKVKRKTATATLLDLAVRRKIRLLHDEASGLYGALLLDNDGLTPPNSGFVKRLFPPSTLWFERKSTRLGDAAARLVQDATKQVEAKDGLILRPPQKLTRLIPILLVAGIGLAALQAVILQDFVALIVIAAIGIFGLVWFGMFAFLIIRTAKRRSPAGALLHDHLMGLREYIRLAEADRIRMLQSASGAVVGEDRVVQVYERLLPYAVLFGLEREWQSELARFYRESTPDWVTGTPGSNISFLTMLPIAGFQSSVSSAAATPSASSGSSSFSSSSGGSSGGGFSGGGGGGGGGSGI